MADILILYHAQNQFPLRGAISDHLWSFARCGNHRCAYVNLGFRHVTPKLAAAPWDLIVFHTTLLGARWRPERFEKLLARARAIKDARAAKVALPQDEFLHTQSLCRCILDFNIGRVLSVAPESEWPKIYAKIDRTKTRIEKVLTGYLDDRLVEKLAGKLQNPAHRRTTDIGYRAWHAEAWLGRHGRLKTRVAEEFSRRAPEYGLSTDISTRERDGIFGRRWYDFLLGCRYTVGVEGGASLLDADGAICRRTREYVKKHPDADFERIERECFPGHDGELRLFALSPRHLEACATKTGQVLVEGEYDGVLRPGEHYIAVKKDFSDVDAALSSMKDEALREKMTERAYRDIVLSGKYSYTRFVETVLGAWAAADGRVGKGLVALNRLMDAMSWLGVFVSSRMLVPGWKAWKALTAFRNG